MPEPKKLRTVVLLSGSGTTLQNFIDRAEAGELPIEIAYVVSSKPNAYGLNRALNHGIPAAAISRKDFPDWEAFNKEVARTVHNAAPELILLAGYMSLFRPDPQFAGKIMNVHPALIPAFCGKGLYGHKVHEAVLEYGSKITGCTVHYADENYDTGPIILQKAVPVLDDDTPDTLAERVQAAEREIYPEAVRLHAGNRLEIEGRRVRILPPPAD